MVTLFASTATSGCSAAKRAASTESFARYTGSFAASARAKTSSLAREIAESDAFVEIAPA